MDYSVVFTSGYDDDIESLTRGIKSDVLLGTSQGDFYQMNLLTLARISGEFDADKSCFLEENLVILHEITKERILHCVEALHKWGFEQQWKPLTRQQLEKYFYPKEDWVVFTVEVSDGHKKS
ncbi:hypothetical protein [Hymenobacter perfusus]|uniref:Uncharacterized protein n=1 Tax=Hymenobacter perfusus TaxID=1236770 RepID=A0A3R9NU37_9BACT|nr:hypothetical protein [Hymenobacter perfusus]RSK43561.1 hypothetical protein EI293_11780 [Hymenobacter perfusus]